MGQVDMHSAFNHWTPDEAAECLSISQSLYTRLWELLDKIPDGDRKPLGGDGTNGTVEYPPEPDSFKKGTVAAIWSKLTGEEQTELNNAYVEMYGMEGFKTTKFEL